MESEMTTNATTETTETTEEQIARLEGEVRDLNRQREPYQNVQPLVAGAMYAGGSGFNPERVIAKRRLDVRLDDANARLEAAKAERARRRLADLGDAGELRAALAATEADEAEARAALRTAQEATQTALNQLRWHQERTGAWQREAAAAEAGERRWRAELERDRSQLQAYEDMAERQRQLQGVA